MIDGTLMCRKLFVDLPIGWKRHQIILTVIEEHVNYCPRELVLVLEDEETWDFLSPVESDKHMP